MSDETSSTDSGEPTSADGPAAARRPSPTANPASRARRIGGRPTPRPTPSADADSATGTQSPRPSPKAATTRTSKAAVDEHPKPAVAERTKPLAKARAKTKVAAVAGDEPARPAARRLNWAWLPAQVLAAAVAVLVVLIVIASHGVYWAKPDTSAGARNTQQELVLASAKKCFATINTYDYRKLTDLVATDLPCTTGKFTSDLKTSLTETIIPQAPKLKAVQSAQVNRAAIVTVSPDGSQWVTLIYGQLVQSNSTTAKDTPRTDLFGAVVTMDHVKGKWLISKVGYDTGNALSG